VSEPEKIKISWDEVRSVSGAVQAPGGPRTEQSVASASGSASKTGHWPWIAAGVGLLFFVLLIAVVATRGGSSRGAAQKVETWIAKERPQWAAEISSSPSVKKFIEDIHPLVTYKRAAISEMRAVTVDGSGNAGRRGENISEVEILVTFYWEGPVTKDGFTEVRFNYDYQGRQLKGRRFERSNAAVNLETVDWFKVGMTIGALVF